jgi:uncharacterized membrane protein (DUF106 family)
MFVIDFIQWSPLASIILISLVLTFLLTWVYKKTINYKKYKEITDRQKVLSKEMKTIKETDKLAEMQNELMKLSMESFKLSLKPMLITFLPVLVIFGLLRQAYTTAAVGNIIYWGTNLPIVGTGGGWFFCYVVLSLIFSFIVRKILKF